jgi:hypothetical protein
MDNQANAQPSGHWGSQAAEDEDGEDDEQHGDEDEFHGDIVPHCCGLQEGVCGSLGRQLGAPGRPTKGGAPRALGRPLAPNVTIRCQRPPSLLTGSAAHRHVSTVVPRAERPPGQTGGIMTQSGNEPTVCDHVDAPITTRRTTGLLGDSPVGDVEILCTACGLVLATHPERRVTI